MSNFITLIQAAVADAAKALYGADIAASDVPCTVTNKEIAGDFTVVVFPLVRFAKKKPADVATELGDMLMEQLPELQTFGAVQGFLNLTMKPESWANFALTVASQPDFGRGSTKNSKVTLEFSSPNTNKPLHLGHIRNILLGWSCTALLEFAGYEVVKNKVVNDRGIAICKSMLAWKKFGNGATPESTGTKPDHFVGKYYVDFEQHFRDEFRAWQGTPTAAAMLAANQKADQTEADFWADYKKKYFNEHSILGREAREMLLAWEAGDAETRALWAKMNDWVYAGFEATYAKLGVRFDKIYYESDTYLLGKDIIEDGLKRGVFYQKPDSSVWIDLTTDKLDHKLVLRSDGTSVYITQDIGMARFRYAEFGAERAVYVVANEQDYHFQVLFNTMKHLGEPYYAGLYHLSYGMVELTTGKMKSREGTIVDADDLIADVVALARASAQERDANDDLGPEDREEIARRVGMGALKYYLLKVQPKKKMVFDPAESLDLHGHTGAYIQYAFVRSQNVARKAGNSTVQSSVYTNLEPQEIELCAALHEFPRICTDAAEQYDPSQLANYVYELARAYNRFYHDVRILGAEDEAAKNFRLSLNRIVGQVVKRGMFLLGIDMPERM